MDFKSPLIHGKLIKRYKRFLVDIEIDNKTVITAHCTNSGSMKSCIEEGAEVYLSHHNNPNRKTQFTWEMIKINGNWVGVNTLIPNKLSVIAISEGKIPELSGYSKIETEKTFNKSRFDIRLSNKDNICYVEVKNVTLKEGNFARFPDSITTRGKKHLEDLMKAKKEGYRAVMLYIVQRIDVSIFTPAYDIDKEYAKTLIDAHKQGVEILVYQAKVSPTEISLYKKLSFTLDKKHK